jgi:hypothetical protein
MSNIARLPLLSECGGCWRSRPPALTGGASRALERGRVCTGCGAVGPGFTADSAGPTARRRPSACRRSMTPLQLEPSAHAPWTSTMFGRAFILVLPSRSVLTAILRSQVLGAVCVTPLHFADACLA